MFDLYSLNHRLQKMSLVAFRTLCRVHNVMIADDNLQIILQIMKNNPYTVLNEDYHPFLLLEIKQKTDEDVDEKFEEVLYDYLIKTIE